MTPLVLELEDTTETVSAKDIQNLFFNENDLFIEANNKLFKLTEFAQTQLCNHLDISARILFNKDTHTKELALAKAIRTRAYFEKRPFVFRKLVFLDGCIEVVFVVTSEYVEVAVEDAKQVFEKILESSHISHSLFSKREDERFTSFSYRLSGFQTEHFSSELTLIAGHSGDFSIRVAQGYIVEKCGNKLLGRTFGVLLHRNSINPKEELLNELSKTVLTALEYFQPTLKTLTKQEESVDEKDITTKFLESIQNYPKYVQKLLREYFYGKYKDEKGRWRISQALSDVGTNAEINDKHREKLQQDAFNILEA